MKPLKNIFSTSILFVVVLTFSFCTGHWHKPRSASRYEENHSGNPPKVNNAGVPFKKSVGSPIIKYNVSPKLVPNDFLAHIQDSHHEKYGIVENEVVDQSGNLWFSYQLILETRDENHYSYKSINNGLCRYDGKNCWIYSVAEGLPDSIINCIIVDSENNVWIGTTNGLCCYDGKNFMIYNTLQGLPANSITSMTEDRNKEIWIGTGRGVCVFNKTVMLHYDTNQGLCDEYVLGILEDEKQNIWLGTSNGLSCFNGKTFTNYTTEQGLANNLFFAYNSKCIVTDDKGNLWLITYTGGVTKFDGKNLITFPELTSYGILSIGEDKNGNILLGSDGCVFIFDGKNFISHEISKGLKEDDVSSITKDKNGNLLLATFKSGILLYDGNTFTKFL